MDPLLLNRTALIVRSHNPSDAALERIIRYAASAAAAGCAAFYVSIDATQVSGQQAAQTLVRRLGAARVHTYTEVDLVRAYPALEDCRARVNLASNFEWQR